jgi:conjugative transfer signal peptidase TraF
MKMKLTSFFLGVRLVPHLVVALLGLGAFLVLLSAAAGFRINVTPSEALGLWRIVRLDRPVQRGDLVFVCPPATAAMAEARRRGYLRRGLCRGWVAPLIKMVAATEGQRVTIADGVTIEGEPLPQSRLLATDGAGRALEAFRGGLVPKGHVYLHSPFPGSFDSRYFGTLAQTTILGLAEEVLTHDP